MSKRTVFGRRRFWHDVGDYKIEMRDDALYIRKRHSRKEWKIPFVWLLRFCNQQLPLFNEQVDKSDSRKAVPGVWEGVVVPTGAGECSVYESKFQPAQDPQVWGGGVVSPTCDHKFVDSNTCLKCGWEAPPHGELPVADAGMDTGNNGENVSGTGEPPGSPPVDAT